MTADESLAVSLVAALDETQDEEGPPVQLYDHVDAEALDRLLAHAENRETSDWELTFAVENADVTVTSDGEVTVR